MPGQYSECCRQGTRACSAAALTRGSSKHRPASSRSTTASVREARLCNVAQLYEQRIWNGFHVLPGPARVHLPL